MKNFYWVVCGSSAVFGLYQQSTGGGSSRYQTTQGIYYIEQWLRRPAIVEIRSSPSRLLQCQQLELQVIGYQLGKVMIGSSKNDSELIMDKEYPQNF